MNIGELLSTLFTKENMTSGGMILLLAMTLVEVSPVKVNPLGWLAKKIGRAINGEIIGKVDILDKEVRAIREDVAEQDAVNRRIRILRFGDEVRHGDRHSHEHFKQILQDIDRYERYCKSHSDFENNATGLTIERIKAVYSKCQQDNDFI